MTIRSRLITTTGIVVVLMSGQAILSSLGWGTVVTWTSCAVSIVITVMLCLHAMRSITNSISTIAAKAGAVGRVELERRVDYQTQNELSLLAIEFNRLAGRIQQETEESAQLKVQHQQELDYQKSLMEHRLATQTRDSQLQSQLATKDELTGLHNRREAINKLELFWSSKTLYSDRLACIMLDIDYFKSFNDTHGHTVGDIVLKETAELLRSSVRSTDAVCRIGGEEFLVICPQSDIQEAASCAEHLRSVVEGHMVAAEGQLLRVTISLGVAIREPEMTQYEDLLKKADDCLYAAKRAGRNRVVVAGGEQIESAATPLKTDQSLSAGTAPKERSATGSIGVLILNGSTRFRKECRALQVSEAIAITEADSESNALENAKNVGPDVILVEATSSKSDLPDSLQRLKTDPATREIPILVIGKGNDDDTTVADWEAYIDEYMTPPLHHGKMIQRVKLLARLYRGQLELVARNKRYEHQKRVMSLLIDFSRSLAAALSLNAVLKKTISMMAELTGCRRISIMFPDDQRKNLTMIEARGLDEKMSANLRVPFGAGMTGRAFQSRKAIVANAAKDLIRGHHQEYDDKILVGFPKLSSPLSVAAHSVGVLNISDRERGASFDAEELEYINQACNMAASAIAGNMSRKSRDQAQDSIVEALGKLAEYRDDDTGRHVQRVTRYSVLLAEELQAMGAYHNRINERFIRDLTRSVSLHDIGKVGIPDYILRKPGKLSLEEMAIMKTHVNMGVELLQSVRSNVPEVSYLRMAEEIAGSHHEWYNGTGYPKQTKGEGIPLAARIVALADVYDALRTKRPYKPPFSHAETMKIICDLSGMQFDPEIVEAFRRQENAFVKVSEELSDESDLLVSEAPRYDRPSVTKAEAVSAKEGEIECYPLAD